MNEPGWPDDHDADLGHNADLGPNDDAVTGQDVADLDVGLPEDDDWELHPHEEPLPETDHDPGYQQHGGEPAAEHRGETVHAGPQEMATVGADPDARPDTDDPAGVFPPVLDVGPLPEPVDGYPWIDTGSLGPVDPVAGHPAAPDPGEPDPDELAEYAAADLPPGVDPWAALADSEDPATSALARFWGSPAGPDQG